MASDEVVTAALAAIGEAVTASGIANVETTHLKSLDDPQSVAGASTRDRAKTRVWLREVTTTYSKSEIAAGAGTHERGTFLVDVLVPKYDAARGDTAKTLMTAIRTNFEDGFGDDIETIDIIDAPSGNRLGEAFFGRTISVDYFLPA